jgi:2-hydroxychromene-2-carboxylate isomerase
MTRTIEFYFDFPSPYSYLAQTQLPKIAAEHGATVTYHPFRILELMTIVGNRPTTIECKNKGKYAGVDLQRWTKRYTSTFPEIRTRSRSTTPSSTARRWLP